MRQRMRALEDITKEDLAFLMNQNNIWRWSICVRLNGAGTGCPSSNSAQYIPYDSEVTVGNSRRIPHSRVLPGRTAEEAKEIHAAGSRLR